MITKLYQLFFQELVYYVTGMTGDRSSAEDIVQETFLRALERADTINELNKSQCRAWLCKTARNLFIDRVRREAARPETGEKKETEDDLSKELCISRKSLLMNYINFHWNTTEYLS